MLAKEGQGLSSAEQALSGASGLRENLDSAKNLMRPKTMGKPADPKDTETHKLSMFVKPGRHHFYFVKKGKYFMLS